MARALQIMTPVCFPIRLVLAPLLLFLALHSNASPTTPRNHNSLVMLNSSSNAIIPHCYTPEGHGTAGIQPVDLKACKDALAVLIRQPDFTTRFRFSKNPRAMAKELPMGWQMRTDPTCRIIASCENDRDTAVFRYADVAQIAKKIIENCVDKPDPFGRYPLLKWGGIHGIKGEETFYVAVARSLRPALEVEVANKTVITNGELVDGGIETS